MSNTRVPTPLCLKKTLKLGFEKAGSCLTSSHQLHTQHGLTSSSYVLKQLVAGNFKLVIAGFYTRAML